MLRAQHDPVVHATMWGLYTTRVSVRVVDMGVVVVVVVVVIIGFVIVIRVVVIVCVE